MPAVFDLHPRMVLSRPTNDGISWNISPGWFGETQPHLVTMENVPRLEREDVFFDLRGSSEE